MLINQGSVLTVRVVRLYLSKEYTRKEDRSGNTENQQKRKKIPNFNRL